MKVIRRYTYVCKVASPSSPCILAWHQQETSGALSPPHQYCGYQYFSHFLFWHLNLQMLARRCNLLHLLTDFWQQDSIFFASHFLLVWLVWPACVHSADVSWKYWVVFSFFTENTNWNDVIWLPFLASLLNGLVLSMIIEINYCLYQY